jgi:hypothetical protein
MKKNEEAVKRYEKLRGTLVATALSTLATESPGNFRPPKHTLTGDTTVEDGEGFNATSISALKASKKAICICGQSFDEDAPNGHIRKFDLEGGEMRILRLISQIERNKNYVGLGLTLSENCEDVQRILDTALNALEEIIVHQMDAFERTSKPVEMQEIETEYVDKSHETVLLDIGISNARSRRKWGVFSALTKLRRRRQQEGMARTSSVVAPGSSAVVQPTMMNRLSTEERLPAERISTPLTDVAADNPSKQNLDDTIEPDIMEPAIVIVSPPDMEDDENGGYDEKEGEDVDNLVLEWTTLTRSQVEVE